MLSADLIREARLRAGITQAELGRRIGRSQSQVARWERGAVTPSFETLLELVRACGFDVWFEMASYDDSYVREIETNLGLSPAERLAEADELERGYEQLRLAGAASRG
jgi:transcriptional regulator with XRE-family HTH domain